MKQEQLPEEDFSQQHSPVHHPLPPAQPHHQPHPLQLKVIKGQTQQKVYHCKRASQLKTNQGPFLLQEDQFCKSEETRTNSTIGSLRKNYFHKQSQLGKVRNPEEFKQLTLAQKLQSQAHNSQIPKQKQLIKFMQYVMEFKLHLRDSYRSQAQSQCSDSLPKQNKLYTFKKPVPKKNERLSCQQQGISSAKIISLKEMLEKYRKLNEIHEGYKCDACGMEPITGKRYHCEEKECWDDYDVCRECFLKNEHKHFMKAVQNDKMMKQIKYLEDLISKYKKKVTSSVMENLETDIKYFSSSIN